MKTFGRRAPVPFHDIPSSPKPLMTRSASSIDSILGDENDALQAKIDQLLLTQPTPKPAQKRARRSDFMDELEQLTSDEEDPLMPDTRSKTVKSVHELVEAGENSRFFDEIEYLVEGLRVGTQRGRQAALEGLLERVFASSGFGSRMRAHGMLGMSIGNCMDLVPGNGRVREGLAVLILYLCHDIRKLDAFISHQDLCTLASHLITKSETLTSRSVGYLKQASTFKELTFTDLDSSTLGLWLLAKLGQPLTRAEREAVTELLQSQLTMEAVRVDIERVDELACVRMRWSLLARDMICPEFSVETCLDDLQAATLLVEGHGQAGTQGLLALKDITRRLVTASGPDTHSHILSTDEHFVPLLGQLLRKCPFEDARFAPVLICLLSTLINLVDRSEGLCEQIRLQDNFVGFLAQAFASVCDEARLHHGLALALLVQDNRSNLSLVQEHVDIRLLLECVQALLAQYQSAGCLTPALDQTLSTLIGRLAPSTFHK